MGVGAGLYMCDVVKKVHVRYLISWWVLVVHVATRVATERRLVLHDCKWRKLQCTILYITFSSSSMPLTSCHCYNQNTTLMCRHPIHGPHGLYTTCTSSSCSGGNYYYCSWLLHLLPLLPQLHLLLLRRLLLHDYRYNYCYQYCEWLQ